MGLHMITGAVVGAIVGSVLSGLARAAGWVPMAWARAFALGVYGGAAIGFLLGALIGALRPREVEVETLEVEKFQLKKRGSSPRRAPVARYRSA
jgi:fructose-specific phosphotransferase system IIC component